MAILNAEARFQNVFFVWPNVSLRCLKLRAAFLEVIVASNFKDDKFVTNVSDDLVAQGLYIDRVVYSNKRITAEFGPNKFRRDLVVGTARIVKGVANDNCPIVAFAIEINGKEYPSNHMVKDSILVLTNPNEGKVQPNKKYCTSRVLRAMRSKTSYRH